MRLLKVLVALGIGLFVAADHTKLAAHRGLQAMPGKWQMVSSRHPGPRPTTPAGRMVSPANHTVDSSSETELTGTTEKASTLDPAPSAKTKAATNSKKT